MPAAQDSPAIFDALSRHGVRFVMIGGLAAILHGSPFPTEDVDITPESSAENLERLSDALAELDARVYTATEPDGVPFAHNATSLGSAGVWNLGTSHGRLDISFVPNGTEGFPDLDRDALTVQLRGIDVRVASLADIIRSKQAANRPKDQRVLPTLREILASRHEQDRG
jgi:predicted nucleotidyltransferase